MRSTKCNQAPEIHILIGRICNSNPSSRFNSLCKWTSNKTIPYKLTKMMKIFSSFHNFWPREVTNKALIIQDRLQILAKLLINNNRCNKSSQYQSIEQFKMLMEVMANRKPMEVMHSQIWQIPWWNQRLTKGERLKTIKLQCTMINRQCTAPTPLIRTLISLWMICCDKYQ